MINCFYVRPVYVCFGSVVSELFNCHVFCRTTKRSDGMFCLKRRLQETLLITPRCPPTFFFKLHLHLAISREVSITLCIDEGPY